MVIGNLDWLMADPISSDTWLLAGAIVLAGVMIAGAILWADRRRSRGSSAV